MNKLFYVLPRERTTYKCTSSFDVHVIQLRFIIRWMTESEVLTVLGVDVGESAAQVGVVFPVCAESVMWNIFHVYILMGTDQ